MNGFSTGCFTQINDAIHPQITVGTRCTTHTVSFISVSNMQCLNVGLAVNRHSGYAHFPTSPHHTNGDFATVCYQYLFKHDLFANIAVCNVIYTFSTPRIEFHLKN